MFSTNKDFKSTSKLGRIPFKLPRVFFFTWWEASSFTFPPLLLTESVQAIGPWLRLAPPWWNTLPPICVSRAASVWAHSRLQGNGWWWWWWTWATVLLTTSKTLLCHWTIGPVLACTSARVTFQFYFELFKDTVMPVCSIHVHDTRHVLYLTLIYYHIHFWRVQWEAGVRCSSDIKMT